METGVGKILVTGFEPWGEWTRNPSGEVARSLEGHKVGGMLVVTGIVPVVHGEDIGKVGPLIDEHNPSAILSLGLGESSMLNVERVAVNLKEIDSEDETLDLPVVEGGPAAYLATLPTRAMVEAIRGQGVPARLSYSAGIFLCNHLMYNVLHYIGARKQDAIAGFIHIPPMPEQVANTDRASMTVDTVRLGVVAALETIVTHLRNTSTA